jgi:large subunit ribosomal protein L18
MAHGPKYTVPLRRKREGLTDYRGRLRMLVSQKPRLVLRKTLSGMIAQIVEYQPKGDKIVASATSSELKAHGLAITQGNVPVSYLTGLLLAKKAKGIKEVVVDIGLQKLTTQSRIYAAVRGAIDGGLKISASKEVLPSDDRINGKHIEQYAQKLTGDAYARQFSAYTVAKVDPKTISALYAKVKQSVMSIK